MGGTPILIAVLAGGSLASSAAAQPQGPDPTEGPVVVGTPRDKWKAFELVKFDAAFAFLGQHRTDRLRQSNGDTIVERESLLRELLDLSGQASIGHPNFIDLTGSAQFGLDHRNFHSDAVDQSSSDRSFVDLFDIRALMLGNGPVPTTLYARREQNLINQGFGGRIKQTVEETGAIAQFRSEIAPTTLQYFHRRIEFDGALDFGDSVTTQDTFTGQSGIRISGNQRLDVAYTFDRINEEQTGFFSDSFDRHDANIVHTLTFGPEAIGHELRSSLRIYDQGGQFRQQNARLDELLVLRHTDRLETRYSATVDDQTRAGQDQQLYRGEVSIRYRLFESLVSSASAGAQRLAAPDNFTSDDAFVSGHLDYTKRVPLGRLNASAGIAYNAQDNSTRGSPLSITRDARVFDDPFPIVLPRRNIVQGSIVLLPPLGFLPYREGIDYTVRYFPDRVEISVPPGSAIQNGQTVLANYDIGPEPANQINTLGTSTSARYSLTEGALRGLSAYFNYRTSDPQLSAADPSLFVLDGFRDLLLGVQYVRSGLDLKYEHEQRTSSVSPFSSDRFQAMYSRPLGRESVVSLDLTHESIEYPLEANRVDFDRITGRWNQRVMPTLDINVRLEYRNERDRLNGDSEGFDQILGFTWHKAQTTVYVSFQNALVQGANSERTSQLLQLGFRREF